MYGLSFCICHSSPCVCCMCQLCNLIAFDHLLSSRHFLRRSSCCQQFMHNLVYIIHSPSRYVICLHAVSSFLVFVNITCICRQVVVIQLVVLFCLLVLSTLVIVCICHVFIGFCHFIRSFCSLLYIIFNMFHYIVPQICDSFTLFAATH